MAKDAGLLKLVALEDDDLAIVSAHLQDAVARVGDMAYLPSENRFAMVVNRFDWVTQVEGAQTIRRRTGVHFDRVSAARIRGLDLNDAEAVLNLLAVEFKQTDAPSGAITLYFSGDAAIQLDVEYIEASMSDLGPEWPARACPKHEAEV